MTPSCRRLGSARSSVAGGTLMELMLSLMLVGVALAPAVRILKQQVGSTRWSTERMMAAQLANDIVDLYKTQGYSWVYSHITPFLAPPNQLSVVTSLSPSWLRYKTVSGSSYTGSGSDALNPVLGGPGPGDPGTAASYQYALANTNQPDPAAIFTNVYKFQRTVEIFGGDNYQPFKTTFSDLGSMSKANCFFVRITISTDNQGTMVKPADQYQVVTIIGQQ